LLNTLKLILLYPEAFEKAKEDHAVPRLIALLLPYLSWPLFHSFAFFLFPSFCILFSSISRLSISKQLPSVKRCKQDRNDSKNV